MNIVPQYTTGAVKDALPKTELSGKICAICEREIVTDGSSVERTYRLTCDHLYPCQYKLVIAELNTPIFACSMHTPTYSL